MQRSFTLDSETEAFLAQRIAAGEDADALVRAGLRLLEQQASPDTATLRRLIETGEASGLSDEDPDVFFDRLEQRRAVSRDRP